MVAAGGRLLIPLNSSISSGCESEARLFRRFVPRVRVVVDVAITAKADVVVVVAAAAAAVAV